MWRYFSSRACRLGAMNFIDVVPEQIETISRHRYTAGVSICIPAYNEEATIEDAIRSAAATLQRSGLAGEILVLDDCSADRTWTILQRLKGAVPNLQIRRHETNQGMAKTFTELYRRANMDLVFLNSADGQWKIEILLDMLSLMKDSDLVVIRSKQNHYRLNRLIVSWFFNLLPLLM